MRIVYRREMKHNYMIIDPEALTWRSYECRMLAENPIEGVLRFQLRQIDDGIRFYYEITSKQPLDRMLDGRYMQAQELRNLVLGISRVLDRMEQYLLREGSVLLEPGHIYVEPEKFRVWLCLVPGLDRDFPEDYGKLLEYLLGKVDHQDQECVVLAYGLYQETRRDNYGMEDILRLLRTNASGQGAPQEEEPMDRRDEDEDGCYMHPPGDVPQAYGIPVPGQGMQREEQSAEKKHGRKRKGIWGRLCALWGGKKKKEETEMVQVPWEMMFHGEGPEEYRANPVYPGGEPERRPASGYTQPERRPASGYAQPERPGAGFDGKPEGQVQWEGSGKQGWPQPGQDTVLLADLSGEGSPALRRLRSLDGETEDIAISYYPFIIGKQENLTDYLLARDTVSRLHLRIDRDGERYFVQDLNSTNGTSVGGRLLENNESAEIRKGDELCIARYKYRFE